MPIQGFDPARRARRSKSSAAAIHAIGTGDRDLDLSAPARR
jgi:hypothetical protein